VAIVSGRFFIFNGCCLGDGFLGELEPQAGFSAFSSGLLNLQGL